MPFCGCKNTSLTLNPQGFDNLTPDLSFNTAVSFATNTNWQAYTGESTMSYLSQMLALVIHNFTSAATGIAIAAALVRAVTRHSAKTIGNFWVDLVRMTYYLLLPICIVFAVFLVSQGMIQNFKPYTKAKLTESYTIQVQKTDDKGNNVTTNIQLVLSMPKLDAKGQPVLTNGVAVVVDTPQFDAKGAPIMTNVPVMVDQKVDGANHSARPHGLASGHQDAGHQRRRLHQCQRRPSLREPDPALEFHSDALHFRHWQRADLLPWPHEQKPGARLVRLGGDDGPVHGRGADLLVGGNGGQSDSPAFGRRRRRRQHGRQGSPLWHFQFRALHHDHDRRFLRGGQYDARFLDRSGRLRSALQHPTGRNHYRRRGGGICTACWFSWCWRCSSPV